MYREQILGVTTPAPSGVGLDQKAKDTLEEFLPKSK
jgi:hypothetical protein